MSKGDSSMSKKRKASHSAPVSNRVGMEASSSSSLSTVVSSNHIGRCSSTNKSVKKITINGDDYGYQNRYEPSKPMSKEDAAKWRREARKQRNRQSAARSRDKVRNRITELEGQVCEWKKKYAEIMTHLRLLEEQQHNSSSPADSSTIIDTLSTARNSCSSSISKKHNESMNSHNLVSPQLDEQVPTKIMIPTSNQRLMSGNYSELSIPLLDEVPSNQDQTNPQSFQQEQSHISSSKPFSHHQDHNATEHHVIETTSRQA